MKGERSSEEERKIKDHLHRKIRKKDRMRRKDKEKHIRLLLVKRK